MGRKSTDKEVRAREESVLRLRSQHVPWERIARSFDPPISLSQAQKDHRKALERRREETAESDDWRLEQEARCEEIARTAWDMVRRLTEAVRSSAANTQALFAIDRFLRTAMAAEDRIAELRGLRLGRRKNGEPTSVNLKSPADIASLLERGTSDALSIDDPDKRSRALLQVIRAAPEVLEKAGPQAQKEEGEAPGNEPVPGMISADVVWHAMRGLYALQRSQMEIMVDAVRRGEHVPEFKPPDPGEEEDAEVLFELVDRLREEQKRLPEDSHGTEVPQDGQDSGQPPTAAQ
jgi:hypothetical protein